MKFNYIFIVSLLCMLVINSNSYGYYNTTILKGAYLGQKTPSLTPEVFAPNVVSGEHHDGGALFTPDMKEFYFTRKDNKTKKWLEIKLKSENNQWHESIVGPRKGLSSISPDGRPCI